MDNIHKTKYASSFSPSEFGKRIREERKKQNISQKELAKMTAKHREANFISNVETEQNSTTLDGAVDIANALGVSLDYLCNRDDFVNKPMTMGDLARALMAISFLQGVELSEKKEPYTQVTYAEDDIKFEHPQTQVKHKYVQSIRVLDGKLRHFLHDFQGIFDRPHVEDFYQMLEKRLEELDEICIWEELDRNKWRESLFLCEGQDFPTEEAERIVWDKSPPPNELVR